jgi:leucyl-tRNA synthetase
MQANWIGRSEGVEPLVSRTTSRAEGELWVFTTRADTLMGVTFVAVAAEHPLAELAARDANVAAFIEECRRGSVMEADSRRWRRKAIATGLSVRHPLTGASAGLGRQLRADGLWRGRGDGRAGARRARLSSSRRSTACRSCR